MDEFKSQLKNNLITDIHKFNSNSKLTKIRELYRNHFDEIILFIEKRNPFLAIEDIAGLHTSLARSVLDNKRLLQQINKAIISRDLTLNDIR